MKIDMVSWGEDYTNNKERHICIIKIYTTGLFNLHRIYFVLFPTGPGRLTDTLLYVSR